MATLDQLISHRFRGFADGDNRLEGLIAALDFGVRQVEFDIRVSACGTPLITHDEHARDARGDLHNICDIRAADLDELGGEFTHVITADTLFEMAASHPNQDCKLLIDVKDAGFEDMIYALCAKHRLLDRAIWVSWLPEVLYGIHDIDPNAKLCLSHWCQSPNPAVRSVHKVFNATNGEIARPKRTYVHGERSGWFVDGPLHGTLRDLVDWVCVPVDQITRNLVEDYHQDGTQVSAFSYLTRDAIEQAETAFGHDAFFCDARQPYDSFR